MGKLLINGGFSIAMFDYWRVIILNPWPMICAAQSTAFPQAVKVDGRSLHYASSRCDFDIQPGCMMAKIR